MENYSYKSNSDSNIDMKLYYCGSEDCSPCHSWGTAIKDHYKIHYICSGKGVFQTEGKEYELTKGHGFLICPGNLSFYKADGENPWSYSWISFNGLNAEAYLSRANLSVHNPIFKYDKDDKILKCFEQMFEKSKLSETRDIKLLSLLYDFFALLIEAYNDGKKSESSINLKDVYIKRAIHFIENNYSRRVSVEEIAQYIGLSRKHLSKLFKQTLNLSLQDFLVSYRLNKACELMKNSTLLISEISISVGYADLFQFSKIFKKHKGDSPNIYRKRLLPKY